MAVVKDYGVQVLAPMEKIKDVGLSICRGQMEPSVDLICGVKKVDVCVTTV